MTTSPAAIRTALFIDFDNVFLSLNQIDRQASKTFAERPTLWLDWLEAGHHGTLAGEDGPPTQPGRIDHVCLSVEDFDVDAIIADLEDYGFTARESASNTPPLVHWISMRMPNRGGIEGGTPEVYFSDPDGIRIQVQDASYCGGGGYLGDICEPLA